MDWTSGYTAEIDYTFGHYGELSPANIDFALLLSGITPPESSEACYLELGFGQGLSVNIHAAGRDGAYWGTDFNPAHAANAQMLAREAGSPAHLFDQSFEDFCRREDLPEFDYIVLHGIWTWVDDKAQAAICDIIRRRLKVGGAVYISYNCQPGWAPIMPVRQLLSLFSEMGASDSNGVMGRAQAALDFASRLPGLGARFFAANPAAEGRLKSIVAQNRTYVVHEYFNRHWSPQFFADVDLVLSNAKLKFASSATLIELIPHLNLTAEQQQFLNEIGQPVLRETIKDYLVNQQFRRDIFVKGPRRLSAREQMSRLNDVQFALLTPPASVPRTFVAPIGEVQLRGDIYDPVLAALAAEQHRPKSLAELRRDVSLSELPEGALLESLTVLAGAGLVAPVAKGQACEAARERTRKLAGALMARARGPGDVQHLPSPVTGGGVPVSRFDQLFLLNLAAGGKNAKSWADGAWLDLKSLGQRIVKDGQVVEDEAKNLEELTAQAQAFGKERLPIYRSLGLVA